MKNITMDLSDFHWAMQIMDNMDSGLVVIDLDFNVVAWNTFMQSYSGIRADKIMHKNLFDACPDLPVEWLIAKLNTCGKLSTKGFSCWEDRPYVFKFKNYSPVTHGMDTMYQNMVITPLKSLTAQVTHFSIILQDVTDIAQNKLELNASNRKLSQLSQTDGLTQLLNRSSWEAQLKNHFHYCGLHKRTDTLVMIDIDHFKRVNDNFGHPAGDEVIRQLAKMVSKTARDSDYVGRYGGEEFAVLLPNTSSDQAMFFADRLRKRVEKLQVTHESQSLSFTISLGVSEFSQQFTTHVNWIEAADKALYLSKRNGRNQATVSQ
ncbi:diguanylate cyclase [Vibrio sp. qd031]|uniref:GGDEF domain-containing protein n=1 Tax=Vibrio sp. qd031 TaxID=1603038 RepID=UPI000A12002D|nr:diguanylate cyclase [Vibrio sp. qd031]ORT49744.1 diguanylate cyclase [Vibrio sp. qd031]